MAGDLAEMIRKPVSNYWSVGEFDRAALATMTPDEATKIEAAHMLSLGLCDQNGKAIMFRIPTVLMLAILRTLSKPDPTQAAAAVIDPVLRRLGAVVR